MKTLEHKKLRKARTARRPTVWHQVLEPTQEELETFKKLVADNPDGVSWAWAYSELEKNGFVVLSVRSQNFMLACQRRYGKYPEWMQTGEGRFLYWLKKDEERGAGN